MKRIINLICLGGAFLCVALGTVGILLPFLPTTPFYLLAGALFAKSSKRFHTWFLSTRLYKNHLHDFVATKSMTVKTKVSILTSVTILLTIGFLLTPVWPAKVVILLVAVFHYIYFLFRVKTIPQTEEKKGD